MENSRTCEICNVNVHSASFVKHLRSRKHLENIEQSGMIITDWLFKTAISYSEKDTKSV